MFFRSFALAGALALFLCAAPISAQNDCDAVLRDGVFNRTTVNSQKSVQDNLYEWLKTVDWGTFKQTQNAGLNLGFPIDGVPFALSGSFSEDQFNEWRRAVDQGRIRNFSSEEFLMIVRSSASATIVNAWLECIRLKGMGLGCDVSQSGDLVVTFTARWSPNSMTDFPPTVTTGGFQISGGRATAGLNPGAEVPIGGASVIITRDSPASSVTVILNTTKGTCQRSVPGKSTSEGQVAPSLVLKTFTNTSAKASWPLARVTVPLGYKVIAGGCRDNFEGYGNMIWACYPEDSQTWVGRGKDHRIGDPSTMDVTAIAIYDPNDEWIVYTQTATSAPSHSPVATASLPAGYAMTGGGGIVSFSGWGQMLTASFPEGTRSWTVKAKDHGVSDIAPATAYVIGIRPRNGYAMPVPVIFQNRSGVASHPSATVNVDPGYIRLGGGAFADWHSAGSMLTSTYPVGSDGWAVSSKDHDKAGDSTTITAYLIGVKFEAAPCTYKISPDRVSFGAAAASSNIVVLPSNSGCRYQASAPDWARISPLGQQTGALTFTVSVDANQSGTPRSGSIIIAGQSVPISQEGISCPPFAVTLASRAFDAAGGSATVGIVGGFPACPWGVSADVAWLTFRPSSGLGPGQVNIFVAPNATAASRTGNLIIAGSTFSITQAAAGFSISGTVRSSSGEALGNATVTFTGGTSAQTDSNGAYRATVPAGFTGRATPSLAGFTFTPASRSYASVGANYASQDYVGTRPSALVRISGVVRTSSGRPLPSVSVAPTGVAPVTTDIAGAYTAFVPTGYTGSVTPTAAGYIMTPPSRAYSALAADLTGQDFVAAVQAGSLVTVSGSVRTTGGQPLSGVAVSFVNGPSTNSDASGRWSASVPVGYSGSVSAKLSGYNIAPAVRALNNLSSDLTGLDFTATTIVGDDVDVTRLAGSSLPVKWFYVMSKEQNWYIVRPTNSGTPGVNSGTSVLMLKAVDPAVAGGIVWKPISNFEKVGNYPAAPASFASISIAPDGRSVTFGSLTGGVADTDVASLANTSQTVRWFYISTESDQHWYIVEAAATASPAVLYLKSVDPGIAGGIRWKPIHNAGPFADSPAAGIRYQSVATSADGRMVTFGPIQ